MSATMMGTRDGKSGRRHKRKNNYGNAVRENCN